MTKNTERCSELIDAAGHGHLELVSKLLASGVKPSCHLRDGLSPLMAAARSGHADVVGLLLQHSSDLIGVS